ncbi:hypothetical protein MVEN_02249200 [Mycena venus]|uniref:Uncharacterized protein n=1 Tax=Mycena venus TaxID=2733690 RepID=A0A8H7CF54_9AGAR|nr:hypothetical protein MVEN_02249200 [Mycena venus]
MLPQIACRKVYLRIRDQLLEENLVTEQQISQCRRLFDGRGKLFSHSTVFRLSQEFPANFSRELHLTVVGSEELLYLNFSLYRTLADGLQRFPWTGSGLACFEPSNSPQYAGRRVVHLRITKIVTPVACTIEGYKGWLLKPEEGQLLTHLPRGHRTPEPWAYDIDAKRNLAAALRILWNSSRIP